ncbi:hypothetical protein M422DRAFT_239699 [Sphaerobolus stellatus SS14]|nr:hypothetical protein M422DRAFT_239699 [Sphaerobolus stellatus SS14]
MPREDSPITDNILAVELNGTEDDILGNFYGEIAPNFEKEVLQLQAMMIEDDLTTLTLTMENKVRISCALLGEVKLPYMTATAYTLLIELDNTDSAFQRKLSRQFSFSWNTIPTIQSNIHGLYPGATN